MIANPIVTRSSAGVYYVTGRLGEQLVQYCILKTKQGWKILLMHGNAFNFFMLRKTKREAVNAITRQSSL
jgi:hypothetical protein